MRERHRYRPVGWDGLEARVALTHGGPIAPGLIGTLSPNPAAAGSAARSIALVNASFNQFTADYLQAQGAVPFFGDGGRFHRLQSVHDPGGPTSRPATDPDSFASSWKSRLH